MSNVTCHDISTALITHRTHLNFPLVLKASLGMSIGRAFPAARVLESNTTQLGPAASPI